jgi:hypothetical protein
MHFQVIQHNMNPGDVSWNFLVQILQKGNQFHLPFTFIGLPPHLASASIKSGKQIERSLAFILMLDFHGGF